MTSKFDTLSSSITGNRDDNINRTLRRMTDNWEADLGVHSHMYAKNGDITLSMIVVPKEKRHQGLGTKLMGELLSYADLVGYRVILTPSTAFGATSVDRLESFYKRFGFVPNRGRKRDFTTRETMIREPR